MNLTKEKFFKSALIILICICCVTAVSVVIFGLKKFQISSQLASVNQVTNLSHLLVRQQANLFSVLLVKKASNEQLSENLDNFAKESFVIDASLYNSNGTLLVQTQESLNLRNQLGLNQDKMPENALQIVEPIYSPNGIAGFLRVTFDAKYGQGTQNKINQLFHQLYGELIIVFLVGVVLASSVHYFLSHYRRAYRSVENQPEIKENLRQTNSLLFHRRRKRFKLK